MASVAEHGGPVGERLDLVHAVRDVEDRDALGFESREHRIDLLHVGAGESRGGLVEDQELRPRGRAPWRSRPSGAATAAGRAPACSGSMSSQPISASSASARRRCARASIRPKRRGGEAIQILSATERSGISDSSWKMHTTPAALAADGVAKLTSARRPKRMRAGIGLHHAGDDLDQRRLAGPVLAQHRMDLAALAGEIDAFEGAHAAIALGNAATM